MDEPHLGAKLSRKGGQALVSGPPSRDRLLWVVDEPASPNERTNLLEIEEMDIGGFREVALCEDLDFVRRVAARGRFVLADGEVATSARRWEQHGVTRTIALMWALRLGYHLGVDPARLARFYADAR